MEKRRRARINSCLLQLKTLVLEAMRKDSSQYSKLEKADILEMTVKHLRNLQRQQMTPALASDPNVAVKYRAGFNECANEVMRYLGSAQGINNDIRSRLVNHLTNCSQTMNPLPQQQTPQQQHMQPLSVQIPQQNVNTTQTPTTGLLMPGNITTQSTANVHVQSPGLINVSPMSLDNKTQLSGSFQIVPNRVYNGPVAVYVGHVNDNQNNAKQSLPIFTLQMPPQNVTTSPLNKNKENLDILTNSSSDVLFQRSKHFQDFISNQRLASCDVKSFDEKLWRPW